MTRAHISHHPLKGFPFVNFINIIIIVINIKVSFIIKIHLKPAIYDNSKGTYHNSISPTDVEFLTIKMRF